LLAIVNCRATPRLLQVRFGRPGCALKQTDLVPDKGQFRSRFHHPLSYCCPATIFLDPPTHRFSPRDPFMANWHMLIGTVHLLKSQIDEAILWLERALSANPALAFAHGHLVAAYALKGNIERAANELAEARRLSGDGRFTSLARLRAARSWGVRARRNRSAKARHRSASARARWRFYDRRIRKFCAPPTNIIGIELCKAQSDPRVCSRGRTVHR
jgi:hypothetical protein